MIVAVSMDECLHRVPELAFDDRLMFAGIALVFMGDLTNENTVLQEMG